MGKLGSLKKQTLLENKKLKHAKIKEVVENSANPDTANQEICNLIN